ncbi:TPA: hypothetical protein ACH3X1_005041 [Trebouxia sp. C0004]
MRCAVQIRPTLAWRRTSSNALRILPKSHLSSGVLSSTEKGPVKSSVSAVGFSLTQLQGTTSSTLTLYGIFFDRQKLTKEAVIIDRVLEEVNMIRLAAGVTLPSQETITVRAVVHLQAERDASFVQTAGLQLKYAINKHCHADHITGTAHLWRIKSGCVGHARPHQWLCHLLLSTRRRCGLLIQGCGRTDFQEGNARQLYKSVYTQLFSLPASTVVYPARNYKGQTSSTISGEKTSNPRLGLSEDKFVELMQNLGLLYPKTIDVQCLPTWHVGCTNNAAHHLLISLAC